MNIEFFKAKFLILAAITLFGLAITAAAQTTVFTYQGRFIDSTLPQPTNGSYEMQYKLFDSAQVGAGSQVAAPQTIASVAVVNGIFTVQLNFGGTVFRSVDLFVEIGVRPVGSAAAFTILAPRQQITTAPLAIRSRIANFAELADNSNALGGIPADQFVQTNDSRLSDDRNPNPFSANYIQNQTANPQVASLNITGSATVGGTITGNIVNSGTQFNLGGIRFLSGGNGNIFGGTNAGTAITTGGDNSFFGTNTGMANTTGINNSFFGTDAGRSNTAANNSFFGRSAGFANTTGGNNAFFGLDAGRFNTTGGNNAFFGYSAGFANTTGMDNSFVGLSSGFSNTTGSNNVFVGRDAGQNNTTGNTNSFFGNFAGFTNTTGGNNTALGNQADVAVNDLNFATAIGAGAVVSTSNTINLGRSNGSDTVRIFGLGAAGGTALCRNALNQISTCTGGGGGSFIDNSTVQQPTSNFNISGNGTVGGTFSANIVNSTTNYRIGGANVFSTPNSTSVVAGQLSNYTLLGSNSAFFGFKAGQAANSFSQANTFIGSESGELTTSGGNNSFVGTNAGFFNTSGSLNSFFGSGAGQSNTTANANSFFGYESGFLNSTGTRNSFFGFQSGRGSATVGDNSFFGYQAGTATTGGGNSFFGSLTGSANNTGANNSFFGNSAGLANNGGSDNAFFGSSSGLVNTSGFQNTFVGSNAGKTNTNGSVNTFLGYNSGSNTGSSNTFIGGNINGSGNSNTVIGAGAGGSGNFSSVLGAGASTVGDENTAIGAGAKVQQFDPMFPAPTFATAIGAGAVANISNSVVLGRDTDFVKIPGDLNVSGSVNTQDLNAQTLTVTGGLVKLTTLVMATNTGNKPLCRNANSFVSLCQNLTDTFSPVLKEQTVRFEAQANQIKEQQTDIAAQAEQIKQLKTQIEALKQIVCTMNPAASICGIK